MKYTDEKLHLLKTLFRFEFDQGLLICQFLFNVFLHIRGDINGKKTFSFGHCPNDGGRGSTHARIFWPSF